ncbi:MAG: hypothetical protein UX60_C0034G0008 [Berkelbacteria bacterium GW2011_GWA2_46_7]|uniref:Uncharacterized protein n=1 Tax=Berkelbacteria bacterium GW2011_GWA2_46_7 TaxID=1618335 RepID=A0A0G1QDT0_9BACT|nr:MAG: hypothetical protein UX60_C0034G0008 [Berkelbacteria bacterium GW2011_GWA2_46_7]
MLVNESSLIKVVSNYSLTELKIVAERLHIPQARLDSVTESFTVTPLGSDSEQLEKDFRKFVTDPGDAHVIAGANILAISEKLDSITKLKPAELGYFY